MTRLFAKISPLDFRIAHHRLRIAVGDLAPGHQHDQARREFHHRAHDVLDQDDGDAALVELEQQRQDVVDLGMRQTGHRLVGDEELGLGRHGAGELDLAHLDLRQVARPALRLLGEADELQQLVAARVELTRRQMRAAARIDGVEQRDADVLGDAEAAERPRQLEAPRHAEAGALMRREAVHRPAIEADAAAVVAQRAAQAVDQRALARAVGPDEADALAGADGKPDPIERGEAAEMFAEILDLEEHVRHQRRRGPSQVCTSPTMPLGAMMTKATSSTTTISRLSAEEMVTVTTCCTVPRTTAPTIGPIQLVMPPISGMAMLLTA